MICPDCHGDGDDGECYYCDGTGDVCRACKEPRAYCKCDEYDDDQDPDDE